jgi:hypothetical protein
VTQSRRSTGPLPAFDADAGLLALVIGAMEASGHLSAEEAGGCASHQVLHVNLAHKVPGAPWCHADRSVRRHECVTNGKQGEFETGGHPGFVEDAGQVMLHGLQAD